MRGMPATFPAHPAAVLPLKLWRPAWFDGVALVVGSMAPDLAYALDGSRLERPFPGLPPLWEVAHSLPWFLVWAVPVTVALCPLIRPSAATLASHLPALPPRDSASRVLAALRRLVSGTLAVLRGYAFLGRGPRWYITVSSAGIGALSHVLWDRIALGPLDLASSVLGGIFGLWLLLHAGHPPPGHLQPEGLDAPCAPSPSATSPSAPAPSAPASSTSRGSPERGSRRRVGSSGGVGSSARTGSSGAASGVGGRRTAVFWATAAAVLAIGGACLPFLPGYFLPHTTSARVILLAMTALLIAAGATRLRPFRRETLQQ